MLARKALAEFVGTFGLVFVGCGMVSVGEAYSGAVPPGAVPVAFGLVVAAMIYSVGHISGAHLNPAVTLAFAIGKHFPRRQLAAYWVAQFGGAIAATALLWVLLPDARTFGATSLSTDVWRGVAWEAMLSFFLMFVIVSVATDTRAEGTMAGVAIGSAVTTGAFLGGPVTGASMNPARTLGPALFAGDASNLWIYFVGPAIGAAMAAVVYGWIRCVDERLTTECPPEKSKSAKGCC